MTKSELLVVVVALLGIVTLGYFTFFGNQDVMLIIYTGLAIFLTFKMAHEMKKESN